MKIQIILLALLSLVLASCAGLPAADEAVAAKEQQIIEFGLNDVQTAHQMAVNAGDHAAAQCYAALEKRLAETGERLEVRPIGPISLYQRARNTRRLVTGNVSEELRAACSWMLLDSKRFLSGLAGIAGKAISGGLF